MVTLFLLSKGAFKILKCILLKEHATDPSGYGVDIISREICTCVATQRHDVIHSMTVIQILFLTHPPIPVLPCLLFILGHVRCA